MRAAGGCSPSSPESTKNDSRPRAATASIAFSRREHRAHRQAPRNDAVVSEHRRDAAQALHQLGFDRSAATRAAAAATGDTLEAVLRSALRYAHFDAGLGAQPGAYSMR
jgi:hypothetical protein